MKLHMNVGVNFPPEKLMMKIVTTYESHYKISRSNIKYLSPFWNVSRMYREYCILFKAKFKRQKRLPLKESMFRHIFNTKFNLSFARLKVDTCRKCDKINAKLKSEKLSLERKTKLDQKKAKHLKVVEKIKKEFCEIVQLARNPDSKTLVLIFDLQRALEVPCIQTSEAYYKRQRDRLHVCIE